MNSPTSANRAQGHQRWNPARCRAISGPCRRSGLPICAITILAMLTAPVSAQRSKVPAWDARGLTAMSWQGVACLDVSQDGRQVAIGTVAPPGEPNVLLLGPDGKLAGSLAAGQRWIQDV